MSPCHVLDGAHTVTFLILQLCIQTLDTGLGLPPRRVDPAIDPESPRMLPATLVVAAPGPRCQRASLQTSILGLSRACKNTACLFVSARLAII